MAILNPWQAMEFPKKGMLKNLFIKGGTAFAEWREAGQSDINPATGKYEIYGESGWLVGMVCAGMEWTIPQKAVRLGEVKGRLEVVSPCSQGDLLIKAVETLDKQIEEAQLAAAKQVAELKKEREKLLMLTGPSSSHSPEQEYIPNGQE